MRRAVVFLGHDNVVPFRLLDDSAAVPLADAVTKVTISVNGTKVESIDAVGGPIRWGGPLSEGEIELRLGHESIAAGRFDCPIVVYDPSNATGVAWGTVPLRILAEVEAAATVPTGAAARAADDMARAADDMARAAG